MAKRCPFSVTVFPNETDRREVEVRNLVIK